MSNFSERISEDVRNEMESPEFDARYTSKNGGRVFWVKASTAPGFGKFVREHPNYDDGVPAVYTTMSGASAAVVADRGDEVRVTAGHTEEFEKVFCLATAGVLWKGEGYNTKAPVLTISGAIHGVALTAAGIEFDNFRFAGPPIDGALSMLKVRAAGCRVANVVGVGTRDSNNFVDCIIVGADANDFELNNVRLTSNGTAPVNSFLSFEGAVSRFTSAGFFATGSVATAGVIDASGARQKQSIISDWRIAVGGAAKPAVTLDTAGSEGMVTNCHLAGLHTTLASNGQFVGDWRLSQVYLNEEDSNASQAAIIPAVDTD